MGSLVFLLAIPAVMYFVLIRPQRKRQREQAEIMSAIDIGDEVVTTSGIYGFITGKEDDKFWLEIDENVQIRIAKAAVQGKIGEPVTPGRAKDGGFRQTRAAALVAVLLPVLTRHETE